MEFLYEVPKELYQEELTALQLDIALDYVFRKMFGRNISLDHSIPGDYERSSIVYYPLVSAYAKSKRDSADFRTSPINRSYFYFTLTRHLSNRVINDCCEYLISSPRDFYHEKERLEMILLSVLEQWNKAKEKHSGSRVNDIMELSALETIYLPIGLVLLWTYVELMEINFLATNLPAPRISELYLQFPFDPDQNGLKTNLADLNERLIKRFLNYFEYSKDDVIQLILNTQEKRSMCSVPNTSPLEDANFRARLDADIVQLLDLIFLKEYSNYQASVTYELLRDAKFLSGIYYAQRTIISNEITVKGSRVEKLTWLNAELHRVKTAFFPINLLGISDDSIAGKFYKHLSQQMELQEKQSLISVVPEVSSLTSFRFIGNRELLKKVINELCNQIGFLDERQTSQAYLFEVLTYDDITKHSKTIAITCETKQLNYIILKLSRFFETPLNVSIGDSKLFLSKTKKKITTSNLRNTKNPSDVKEKLIIDRILKHLQ